MLKNTFKYKRAYKYTKIKWMIIKFMLYRSYILHFRVRMVHLSKSLHPTAQGAFESWSGPILQVLEPPRYVSAEQFCLEKQSWALAFFYASRLRFCALWWSSSRSFLGLKFRAFAFALSRSLNFHALFSRS
jgi:hypothetical protein